MKARWFFVISYISLFISNVYAFHMGKYGESTSNDIIFFTTLSLQVICGYIILGICIDKEMQIEFLERKLKQSKESHNENRKRD